MISAKEAYQFLTKNLGFDADWKTLAEEKPVEFLKQFLRKHVSRIYYQNISLAISRKLDTEAEMATRGLSGKGHVCFTPNFFVKMLLDAIGFDTFVVAANVPIVPLPRNHNIVVVRIEGSLYLLDVGMAQPFYDVICINPDKLPFKRRMFGFEYEYRYDPSNKIYLRVHKKGNCGMGAFPKEKPDEDIFMTFDLTPRTYNDFVPTMSKIYTETKWLLRYPYMTRFFEREDEPENPGYVYLFKRTVCEGDMNIRKVSTYETYADMVPHLKHLFPNILEEELSAAIESFEAIEREFYSVER